MPELHRGFHGEARGLERHLGYKMGRHSSFGASSLDSEAICISKQIVKTCCEKLTREPVALCL